MSAASAAQRAPTASSDPRALLAATREVRRSPARGAVREAGRGGGIVDKSNRVST